MTQPVDIVMRARNDMPIVARTLRAISEQKYPYRLFCFDNASDDGTTEEAKRYAHEVVNVPAGTYIPGRVLNEAMEATESEFVVFVNSDCPPCDDRWLETLVSGFAEERIAAVFGRQIPRPDCWTLFAKDTEDTFGNGERQKYWRHCFSMASSAVRRSVWNELPFRVDIQYSEDVDWTWRARQQGFKISYVAESVVEHSHNYTLKQFYKRQYGEGKAEANIFEWEPWQAGFLRYSLMPYVRQVLSDTKYCLSTGNIGSVLHSPFLRGSQMFGRRAGFLDGMKEKRA